MRAPNDASDPHREDVKPTGMLGAPSLWIPYVLVDNLAAATKKAKELGAKAIKENQPVQDMGAFSIITDPTGATLGLWESKRK